MKTNVPRLENDRIRLRFPEPEDLEILYQWENDISLWHVSNTQTPISKYVLKDYIRRSHSDIYVNRQLRLMISLPVEPEIIVGMIDLFDFEPYHLRAGLGIVIDTKYQTKGFAAESINLVTEYSRHHLGLKQLYANITENNTASIALFQSLGFELTGEKKEWTRIGDQWLTERIYQKFL